MPQQKTRVRAMRHFDRNYERESDLPQLLGVMPGELQDTVEIVCRLEKALALQKRAARSAGWRYDINRHIRLLQALKVERARMQKLKAPVRAPLKRTTAPEEPTALRSPDSTHHCAQQPMRRGRPA